MDKKTNQKCIKVLMAMLDNPDVDNQLKAKTAMFLMNRKPDDPFDDAMDFINQVPHGRTSSREPYATH